MSEENVSMKILQDLTLLQRVFCSDDYRKSVDYLCEILPFEIQTCHPEQAHNGWEVPPNWKLKTSEIRFKNEVIYDGTHHPLATITHSAPFSGKVSLEELKEHLFFDRRYKDAIPYHFRNSYRPWKRDWGFCVTANFYESLEAGEYEVLIDTEEKPGAMDIMEYTVKGESDLTFCFVAHLDHPGMANDDLAGCAVCVELFRRLSKMKTKFSYRLLLLQEIVGSEIYLSKAENREHLLEAVFIEMMGTETELALQHSVQGLSGLENAMHESLKKSGVKFRSAPFKQIICNDEIVFEAYGIPMSSLSRYPYREYHTHFDNADLMSQRALNESLNILESTIEILEKTYIVRKKFEGILCVSNPKYDLYVDPGQPALDGKADETIQRLRLLMDRIPMIKKPMTTRQLAMEVELPEKDVLEYLRRWEAKGLVELI